MGKGKKSTTTPSFGVTGWYASVALFTTATVVVLWAISMVAKLVYPKLDARSNLVQMVALWEVIDGICALVPNVIGLLLAITVLVCILETKRLKVVSAVTQDNQTLVISPDENPLHSVQISTGTHVRLPEQNSGVPPSAVSEQSVPPESPEPVELTAPDQRGKKHEISKLCRSWHAFWRKIGKATDAGSMVEFLLILVSRDYSVSQDEGGDAWVDNEDSPDVFVGQQKIRKTIDGIDEQLIDLDVEEAGAFPLTDLDAEREKDSRIIEERIARAEERLNKQNAPSGDTGEITRSIDAALNKGKTPLDGVNEILEECNAGVGENVTKIVNSTEDTNEGYLDDGMTEETPESFLKAQANMAKSLEEDGFDIYPAVTDEPQAITSEHSETSKPEVAEVEPNITETPVTSLAAQVEFDAETAQVLEMIMKIVEFMRRKSIKNITDLANYLATAKAQQTTAQEVEKVDAATLDKLCLRHQVELTTTDDALVVDYPDQDGVTFVMAMRIEDSALKHRAIAHNLGLFPEELNYALGYLHAKISDIDAPEDVKSIWNIAPIAIAASGLRDGYDPSACVRPKESNVARFLEGQDADSVLNEGVQPEADPAKVFPFPSYQEEESSSGESLASGTGRLPHISRALGRRQHW